MAFLAGEDRGQATQVGAILIFGILIIAMAGFQANIVPAENKQVEYSSYLSASSDLSGLKSDLIAAGQEGVTRERTVQTGTTYPARALFLNPAPPIGRLQTTTSRNAIIWNADAVDSEETNTQAYWNGTRRNVSTKKLLFSPSYNEFDASSVAVSSIGVTRCGAERTVGLSSQSFVNDRRISLVAVRGNLSAGGISTPVITDPISAPTQRVTITNESESDLVISLPFESNRTRNQWMNSSIAEGMHDTTAVSELNPAYIHRENLAAVNVTFEPGTYTLGLGLVEVRGQNDRSDVSSPKETYLIPTQGNETAIKKNQQQRLTVEVRDQFDNPVSGVAVSFNTSRGTLEGNLNNETVTTNEDGRASVMFAPSQTGNLSATASFPRSTQFNSTGFDISVSPSGGGGGGTGSAYTVSWYSPNSLGPGVNSDGALSNCSTTDCTYDVAVDSDTNNITLRANTGIAAEGFIMDYAVNNSSIGQVIPSENLTNRNGNSTTVINVTNTGDVAVYAASGGSVDQINMSVISIPVAVAGGPYSVNEGTTIQLDGTGSRDELGSIASYNWAITSNNDAGSLSDAGTATPDFTADSGTAGESVTVELTVTDNEGLTDTTTATINIDSGGAGAIQELQSESESAGNSGKASFTLENSGTVGVDLVAIAFNSTDSAATELYKKGINTDQGTVLDIPGGQALAFNQRHDFDNTQTLTPGQTVTFNLDRFDDGMKGHSLTFTIYLGDGSQSTFTVNF